MCTALPTSRHSCHLARSLSLPALHSPGSLDSSCSHSVTGSCARTRCTRRRTSLQPLFVSPSRPSPELMRHASPGRRTRSLGVLRASELDRAGRTVLERTVCFSRGSKRSRRGTGRRRDDDAEVVRSESPASRVSPLCIPLEGSAVPTSQGRPLIGPLPRARTSWCLVAGLHVPPLASCSATPTRGDRGRP